MLAYGLIWTDDENEVDLVALSRVATVLDAAEEASRRALWDPSTDFRRHLQGKVNPTPLSRVTDAGVTLDLLGNGPRPWERVMRPTEMYPAFQVAAHVCEETKPAAEDLGVSGVAGVTSRNEAPDDN